ncbi:DUF1801 domain-containing protein [Leptospira langatensis]|uniref:DUF1801 domain-containing protein n=1 Tax=Leptospira langatensis TaxID=2484983 RepID=A0A5F1ZTM9_9LEPT|nr:DUF1801 domain-containing protein [Leptospira langatensis]TGK03038.1 DUF1801 domain-containing protein [Leptospira langatensis]TGL41794.1 DUF1801 domain-containing protein [Leptospira langatensis]
MKENCSPEKNLQIIQEILQPMPEEILEIVDELRKSIQSHFPELQERGYPVWKAIGYRDKSSGYVCGIFPFPERVQLIFEWGILYRDPKKVLLGDQKQIRYLEYRSLKEIQFSAIQGFISQGLALPPGTKDKKFLAQGIDLKRVLAKRSADKKPSTRKGKS